MSKLCHICGSETYKQPCTSCGYFDLQDKALTDPFAQNQILMAKKIIELQRQLEMKPAVSDAVKPITVLLSGLVKPFRLIFRKINLESATRQFQSFVRLSVRSELQLLTEQLHSVPALRLAEQKDIIGAMKPWKPEGPLKSASVADLLERQRKLFRELLENEKARIRQEFRQEVSKFI